MILPCTSERHLADDLLTRNYMTYAETLYGTPDFWSFYNLWLGQVTVVVFGASHLIILHPTNNTHNLLTIPFSLLTLNWPLPLRLISLDCPWLRMLSAYFIPQLLLNQLPYMKLGVLHCLCQIFSLSTCLFCIRASFAHGWNTTVMCVMCVWLFHSNSTTKTRLRHELFVSCNSFLHVTVSEDITFRLSVASFVLFYLENFSSLLPFWICSLHALSPFLLWQQFSF